VYHHILIVGNLGRDPEMRYTNSDTPVTSFNVASNRQYTKDGEKVKETTWFRVSVFGKQAEPCATYLKKGSAVLVEGRLSPDPETGGPKVYEKKDGDYGASFDVIANTVRFLSSRGEGSATSTDTASNPPAAQEEDIPF